MHVVYVPHAGDLCGHVVHVPRAVEPLLVMWYMYRLRVSKPVACGTQVACGELRGSPARPDCKSCEDALSCLVPITSVGVWIVFLMISNVESMGGRQLSRV